MMNKTVFMFLALLSASVFFWSCSSDETDTEKPVIEISSPADHAHFHPGDIIHFDAEFSDNVGLKQFKIDIHWGEGHDHKSGQHDDHGHAWSYEYIGELYGRNKHIHMDITIPEDAKHGEYHFLVFVTDKAGNEAFVALEIEIEDDHDDHK